MPHTSPGSASRCLLHDHAAIGVIETQTHHSLGETDDLPRVPIRSVKAEVKTVLPAQAHASFAIPTPSQPGLHHGLIQKLNPQILAGAARRPQHGFPGPEAVIHIPDQQPRQQDQE